MADIEPIKFDDPHETLVREYVSGELDRQVGRAEAKFREYLAQPPVSARPSIWRLPNRLGGWTFGVVGAALAASLAALWAGPSLRSMTPTAPNPALPGPGTPAVISPTFVEQDLQTQTVDDGTFLMDGNTPVRVLRRRDVERTRWFDKDRQLQGEEVVPQDHIVYVQVKTY